MPDAKILFPNVDWTALENAELKFLADAFYNQTVITIGGVPHYVTSLDWPKGSEAYEYEVRVAKPEEA